MVKAIKVVIGREDTFLCQEFKKKGSLDVPTSLLVTAQLDLRLAQIPRAFPIPDLEATPSEQCRTRILLKTRPAWVNKAAEALSGEDSREMGMILEHQHKGHRWHFPSISPLHTQLHKTRLLRAGARGQKKPTWQLGLPLQTGTLLVLCLCMESSQSPCPPPRVGDLISIPCVCP